MVSDVTENLRDLEKELSYCDDQLGTESSNSFLHVVSLKVKLQV